MTKLFLMHTRESCCGVFCTLAILSNIYSVVPRYNAPTGPNNMDYQLKKYILCIIHNRYAVVVITVIIIYIFFVSYV